MATSTHVSKRHYAKGAKVSYRSYGGLQCVPFAREASGIEIKGNAANWWEAAAGVYERGYRPEPGSVLNFRAVGRMRLGHVAVVTEVVDARHITIDHANWTKGIARAVPVEDVSDNNDWSAVRVGLGHTGGFGSVYPTYGFIYDRPDTGGAPVMVAAAPAATPVAVAPVATAPVLAAKPDPTRASYQEVAEAPRRLRNRPILRLDLPPSDDSLIR